MNTVTEDEIIDILNNRFNNNESYEEECAITNIVSDFRELLYNKNNKFNGNRFWNKIFNEGV